MIRAYRILFISILLGFFVPVFSQNFFRIKTDFEIKAQTVDGLQQLTTGTVYYDKSIKQIVYDVRFPNREIWVQRDTVLYKIVNSKVESVQTIPGMIEFTVYHLILNGNLSDYGLKSSNFKLKKVEKTSDGVISTWEPPNELKKVIGDILIMNSGQQLLGVVMKDTEDEVVSRQFFRNYNRVKGLSFPQEIIKENYSFGKKFYEITTYSNTIVNDYSDNKYAYKIPQSSK